MGQTRELEPDEFHVRMVQAPSQFREALKAAKAGAVNRGLLCQLAQSASMEIEARRTCTPTELVACKALAVEMAALGGDRAACGVQRVRTTAQAAGYIAQACVWLRSRESHVMIPSDPVGSVSTANEHTAHGEDAPVYAEFDRAAYDFRGVVLRMLREQGVLDGLPADCHDPLASLHLTDVGQRELGYLSSALAWVGQDAEDHHADGASQGGGDVASSHQGLVYSQALDDATRYGCGSFNRAWKSSKLRDEFLALYERFVSEVIAPALSAAECGGLVYQAQPIFRVFLPYHLGVGPRHVDASYHPQPNELNIWMPLTDCFGTNSLFVESLPGLGDYEPIACGFGTMYQFRGNACEHFTELNVSGQTRVSIDFRVIRPQELPLQPVPDISAPAQSTEGRGQNAGARKGKGAAEYFSIGRYYKQLPLAERRAECESVRLSQGCEVTYGTSTS